jgi:hypothetical protein
VSQVCSLGLHVEMCVHFISLDDLPDSVWPICASTAVKACHMPDSFCCHSTKKRCVLRDMIGFSSTININEMDTQRHVWVYRKTRCIASCSISIKIPRHMEGGSLSIFCVNSWCGRSQVLVSHTGAIVAWRRGRWGCICWCGYILPRWMLCQISCDLCT